MDNGENPTNRLQMRFFFCMYQAGDSGENRHPQTVMKELATKHGFTILAAVPQSIADGWDFWVESKDELNMTELPPLFRSGVRWKPVGQA